MPQTDYNRQRSDDRRLDRRRDRGRDEEKKAANNFYNDTRCYIGQGADNGRRAYTVRKNLGAVSCAVRV